MDTHIVSAEAVDCSQIAEWSREVGWDVDYQQVGKGSFKGDFSTAFCGDLRVTRQYCNRNLTARGVPPPGMMSVLIPTFSAKQTVIQGVALGKCDAAVMEAGSVGLLQSPPDLRMYTVSVSEAKLQSALWDYARCDLSTLLSDCGVTRFPKTVIEQLRTLFVGITCPKHEVTDTNSRLEMEDRVLQLICDGLLSDEFDFNGRERTKYVLRAREHIDAHIGDVLRVGSIASNVGVSGRTLELAFREVLGTTVVEYIRLRRLNLARRYLQEQPSSSRPVSDAASRFGLFHFGYFSRDYKRLFGQSPSQTTGLGSPWHF